MLSNVITLILLVLLNAFFAATEMAFISVNDNKIKIMVNQKNKKAIKLQRMLENPSKFLATIQIGITLAGFLSSAFAADTFADKLALALNNITPSVGSSTWKSISIIIITIILAYFTLVFGELVPKRIAMKYPEKMSFASCNIINLLSVIVAPFVSLLTISTNAISKLFGVNGEETQKVTEEEIKMLVNEGKESGTIQEKETEMINNVFEFNDKFVSEIMIPRTEVFALDMNLSIAKVIEELSEDTRYSRIPVYDETIDEIKGIVYIKDILLSKRNSSEKIKDIMKEAYFVPENKLVNKLFEDMRKSKKQIAIVVDEYRWDGWNSYNGRYPRRNSRRNIR